MTRAEFKELRLELTTMILHQWVDEGMTPEEAKTLWRECEAYGE